jgi:hypothetical protein
MNQADQETNTASSISYDSTPTYGYGVIEHALAEDQSMKSDVHIEITKHRAGRLVITAWLTPSLYMHINKYSWGT